ncbi:MAG: folate-binding protein YgfZ [Leptolyngbya sp. SIO4C1]|nr:folate-binding protein YgfZ [Leptolyngbya sp. SIO4C1]
MTTPYQAAHQGLALIDRSHWGRIRVAGDDRMRFLHNQTTQAFEPLQPGQSCETVFVTATARTIDLVTAYVEAEAVLLLTSPGLAARLLEWMDRYIFFADKVTLEDISDRTFTFTLIGPQAAAALSNLGLSDLPEPGQHSKAQLADATVNVAAGTGLALPGYTLMGPKPQANAIWSALADAAILSATDWEQLRLEQGRPLPGHELTEEDNPLEAGLWHAISFEKGCYIGQETIARLNTYQGVKKQLWGLQLSASAAAGDSITYEGEKVGRLTSIVERPAGTIGLGYIRTKAGGAGLSVQVGEASATVVEVPYLSRGYLTSADR